MTLRGRVQSGTGRAAHFLSMFEEPYGRKTGMQVFPGSLNVGLDSPFDWFDPRWCHSVIHFNRVEYGGERDILLLPCRLSVAPGLRAFLWSTATAARDPADRRLAEVIAPVSLRDTYGLRDDDVIEIELVLKATS